MRIAAALLLALSLVAPTSAAAQQPQAPATTVHRFGWVLEGGVEYGGDVLVTLLFDDGSDQDILAGQGGTVAFGFDYRPARMPQLGLRSTGHADGSTTIGIVVIILVVAGLGAIVYRLFRIGYKIKP